MWAETARSGTAPLAMGIGAEQRGQTGTWRVRLGQADWKDRLGQVGKLG